MYVVIAYRWGHLNEYQYIVYAGPDKTAAMDAAQHEPMYRGGKYGCTVFEMVVDTAGGYIQKPINHVSSMMGEPRACRNTRREFFEEIGQRVNDWVNFNSVLLPAGNPGILAPTAQDPAPDWLVNEVKRLDKKYNNSTFFEQ